MTMTSQDKLTALKQVDAFVSTDPTMDNVAIAENLIELLRVDPDSFWDAFLEAVTKNDGPFRAQAEELIARFGADATFADMKAIAEQ
jgi:hypothetical protein